MVKIHDYSIDLIANLFNPDLLVSETAAWALFHLDPKLFHENISRLNPEFKRLISETVIGTKENDKKILKLEKVKFLKNMRIFNEVPGRILANLVDYIEEVTMHEGTSYPLQGNNSDYFFIIYSGEVNYYSDGKKVRNMRRKYFIGELADSEDADSSLLIAQEKALLFKISKEKFYEQLSDNFNFANQVIRYLYAG
jgi:CRP-like cAMP-binding protein